MTRLTSLLQSDQVKRVLPWAGRLMTLAVVVYLVYRLGQLGWNDLLAALPTSPWFYALFLVIYLTQPLAELITYRQIWPVPSWTGLRALIRKRVFNEEMAGYSGEVYFFWWLYKKLGVARDEAFRAVRDVNILSSVASMTTAAALLAILGGSGILELNKIFGDVSQAQILIGLGLTIALGVVLYQFRTYLFALPKPTAYRILGIHYSRLIVVNGLFVVQWSVGVPDIGLAVWLTYLCLLIVLNRVPFLPSKDLFFLSLGMGLSDSLGQATTAIAGMLLVSSVLVRTTNFGLYLATHFSDEPDFKPAGSVFDAADQEPGHAAEPEVAAAAAVSMRVLVWATTFGADLWSLTRYLDQLPGVTLRVVMDDPNTFLRQGVAKLFPLKAEIVKRRWYHHLPSRKWDLTIIDNRIPFFRTSKRALILWHGFGWKGPNDEKEFWLLHLTLKRTWDDIRKPSRNLIWQAFGPWDFKHRTEVSAVHPDNCIQLGSASHDDLVEPLDRNLAQPYYPFDVVNRKTVLIAPTWHYGEVFAHWGKDSDLFGRLLERVDSHGANAIIRLHDSYRFDAAYREFLDRLTARFPNVCLKFKDTSPDNYLDLQVSDVLITNFSSIANLFYATGRPTIHVYPVRSADEAFIWRQLRWTGVREKHLEKARYIWKLPPEEHGGLLARNFDDLLDQIDKALVDPDCCGVVAREFLDRHMLGADGHNRDRIWEAMQRLAGDKQHVSLATEVGPVLQEA